MSAPDQDEPFCKSVAQAVISLIEKGLTDPSTQEIADEYFEQPYTPLIKSEVQSRLPYICKVVQEERPRAHLVCDTYYNAFQESLPTQVDTAQRCIPGGRGRQGVGIRIPQVDGDVIYLAHVRQNIRSGGGKCQKNMQELEAAYLAGDISGEDVVNALGSWSKAPGAAKELTDKLKKTGAINGPLFQSKDIDALPE